MILTPRLETMMEVPFEEETVRKSDITANVNKNDSTLTVRTLFSFK